jgi:hypothetical protein
MKRLRRASRLNVFPRTKEVVENDTVILEEAGGIVTTWDIQKSEHTLLIVLPDTDTTQAFENIAAHVEKNTDTLDYLGIDLFHTMFADITEQQTKRLALTLEEAVELTAALVSEIDDRKENGVKGKKIRVLIKDGHDLFNLEPAPEAAELYTGVLANINYVLTHGEAVDVTVFMEVDTDTAEQDERPEFTNAIILK